MRSPSGSPLQANVFGATPGPSLSPTPNGSVTNAPRRRCSRGGWYFGGPHQPDLPGSGDRDSGDERQAFCDLRPSFDAGLRHPDIPCAVGQRGVPLARGEAASVDVAAQLVAEPAVDAFEG